MRDRIDMRIRTLSLQKRGCRMIEKMQLGITEGRHLRTYLVRIERDILLGSLSRPFFYYCNSQTLTEKLLNLAIGKNVQLFLKMYMENA